MIEEHGFHLVLDCYAPEVPDRSKGEEHVPT